jgi:hypothetical protein
MSGRLVEVFRAHFPCRASAARVVTAARELGLDVEVRNAGGEGVLVVAEGLRADVAAGERIARLAPGAAA